MLVSDAVFDKNHNEINLERLFALQGYTCETYFERTSEKLGRFSVVYLDATDEDACSIDFNLSASEEEVPMFYIEEMNSQDGIGTKVFAKLIELAKRCGIERMEVNPLEVGGYFWARVGFLPVEECMQPLAKLVSENSYGDLSFASHIEFRDLVKSEKGKEALLDTDWYGYLDLSDPEQMRFCKDYISSKLGKGI